METTKTVWKADATHSSAEFSVRHMMISTVKGRFKDINVEYEGDVDDLTRGVARVEIGTSSVETLDPDRDNHLRSDDFFNSEKFPKMSFVSKKIESVGNSKYKITGDLTVRDVTKEITLDGEYEGNAKDPWGNERIGINVNGEIVREDFGLKWNTPLDNGGVLVGSKVKFEVRVELLKQQ
ncbi:hypothetical protein IX51_05060 [uncultured archaeon]|nr:hypothetical protein IX51_05060 [uncultured archaeon]